MRPALRCVMTTHRQADLGRGLCGFSVPPRSTITITLASLLHIDAPGTVRIGDPVVLVK